MATYAKLSYNGKVQTVALFEGLNTEELTSLLKTVFSVEGNIVGLMAEKGLVLPISLVSKSPSVVPNTVCKLLVASAAEGRAPNDRLLSTQTNKPVSLKDMPADLPVEESNYSEADSSEVVTTEILEFIDGLRVRNFLTASQASLLNSLLASNSTLLFAAYSVAISANDSEYLAEICKDLAQSLVTEQGRSACEAQDEVLQVSDQLYINNRITENQLLYLRHLVLIREEVVAKIYDQFQEDQNVPKLAKALYELCNTHPYQQARQQQQAQQQQAQQKQGDSEEEEEDGVDEDEDDEDEEHEPQQRKSNGAAQMGLSGVVGLMMRAKRLSSPEASILLELIRGENEYVMAAYELYESDQKLDELQDTLLRCAKLEMRKRALEAREQQLDAQYQQRTASKYDAAEDATEEDDGDEDDDEADDDEDEEEDDTRFTLEDIGVDSILESLDVVNIWENTVPAKFVKTVFIAVIRKQLDIYQAKALCDLYHANYDLVRSAWEVYTVQEDTTDLLDTLRRVVKDLTLDEDDDEEGLASSVDSDGRKPAQAPAAAAPAKPAAKPAPAPAVASKPAATSTASTNTATSTTSTSTSPASAAQAAMDRKQEALAAVSQAKRDLLKHSLEMMVKQNIISGEAAANLYRRYLQGDNLAEAAIDAYASDRNVAEFLDTLQILASHTPAELSEMMKDVAEEAAENAVSASPTAVNTRANAHISPTASARHAAKPVVPEKGAVPVTVATAQLQLKGIVAELARNQMISAEVHSILNRLVAEPDRRLIVAFERYMTTQEGAKLIDTLLHVAAAELALQSQATANTAKDEPEQEEEEEESEDEEDEEEDEAQGSSSSAANSSESLLNAQDQKTVVDILARANALTSSHAQLLHARVDAGDAHVRQVFSAYESNKDVYQLIDALKALNLESGSSAAPAAEEEDAEEETEFDEDDGATIESKFLQIVQRMQLTHLETAALRLAIARDDNAVKLAIEAFRSTLNENALMSALRDVARDTIANTMAEQEEEDEEEEQNEQEQEDEDQDNDEEDEDADEDEDDEDGDNGYSEYSRSAEAREVDELIRRYSSYNSSSQSEGKTASPGGYSAGRSPQQQPQQAHSSASESRAKAGSQYSSSAYDYKTRDVEDEDEKEQSEEEEDEDEEDEEEEEEEEEADNGTSLITSQAARNHVFPILINELVKENILTSRQGTIIMKQFSEGSAVISAAIDVYDRNSDLGHLVQTLQATAERTR